MNGAAVAVGQGVPAWIFAATLAGVALAAVAMGGALRHYLLAYRERLSNELRAEFEQAFLFIPAPMLLRLHLASVLGLAVMAYALTGEPLPVLAGVVVAGLLPPIAKAWVGSRRRRALVAQFPDAVMLLSGGLRAGASLSQALAQATEQMPRPVGLEFGMALREQRLGLPLNVAMANLEARLGFPEATLLASALRVAQGSGGNLAETLERLAGTLRRKQELEGRIDALTAQGRMQGWVMVLLPIAIGAALFAIEPDAMRPLVQTWYGWAVCAVVLCLELAGLYFIRRIVRIDV
jgi:tight adherence protein B